MRQCLGFEYGLLANEAHNLFFIRVCDAFKLFVAVTLTRIRASFPHGEANLALRHAFEVVFIVIVVLVAVFADCLAHFMQLVSKAAEFLSKGRVDLSARLLDGRSWGHKVVELNCWLYVLVLRLAISASNRESQLLGGGKVFFPFLSMRRWHMMPSARFHKLVSLAIHRDGLNLILGLLLTMLVGGLMTRRGLHVLLVMCFMRMSGLSLLLGMVMSSTLVAG